MLKTGRRSYRALYPEEEEYLEDFRREEADFGLYDDLGRTPPRTRLQNNRKWRDNRKQSLDQQE